MGENTILSLHTPVTPQFTPQLAPLRATLYGANYGCLIKPRNRQQTQKPVTFLYWFSLTIDLSLRSLYKIELLSFIEMTHIYDQTHFFFDFIFFTIQRERERRLVLSYFNITYLIATLFGYYCREGNTQHNQIPLYIHAIGPL